MARVDLIMPKMGESIMEATIIKWLVKPGDQIKMDETILEIATDKVDSEIPSPVNGKVLELLYKENDVVPVGIAIAHIQTEGEDNVPAPSPAIEEVKMNGTPAEEGDKAPKEEIKKPVKKIKEPIPSPSADLRTAGTRFYSPLVKNIARREGIATPELEQIIGTGKKGRVTKKDILGYVAKRKDGHKKVVSVPPSPAPDATAFKQGVTATPSGDVEIIEMDRMRKLIAEHMVRSKQTSAHVTSFVEVDVTEIVKWREKVKSQFLAKYGQKITYTPIFVDAVIQSIKEFPMINISIEGTNILRKTDINIGMATALPSGNLIVPVIKNADNYNLVGLTKKVNDLAKRARENRLIPEEIQDGTFTLTNVGTFGNVMGTPIINQPQVAILATGAIRKKPAVLETEFGDVIAIRQLMFLSLSYDHRIVDGYLGGSFLRRVADHLENFDTNQTI